MHPPRVIFVSYYSLHPIGLIGVLKRCLRLISGMTNRYEIYLLNFGEIPPEDPVFQLVKHRVRVLTAPDSGHALTLLKRMNPATIIFGECPVHGMMLETYRAATRCGMRQIGIENYYGRPLTRFMQARFLHIRRWLLLGLLNSPQRTASHWGFEVAPPLVQLPAKVASHARNRIVINGYHPQTLIMAYECLKALPGVEQVDFLLPQGAKKLPFDLPFGQLPHEFHLREAISDAELFESVAQAKVVLGKAGFQQIVESALLGAPVVCQMYDSGVYPFMVPSHLKAQVKLVWSQRGLHRALPQIRAWVEKPAPSWTNTYEDGPDFVQLAARQLEAMIDAAPRVAA
jgi:hypothetical protein